MNTNTTIPGNELAREPDAMRYDFDGLVEITLLRSVADHLQLACVAQAADTIEAQAAHIAVLKGALRRSCKAHRPQQGEQ